MESYLSRWPSVLASVRSFTATTSIEESPSVVRKILRPMRPNPFIATFTGIFPPRVGGAIYNCSESTEGKPTPDARARGEKSQRRLVVLLNADDRISRERHLDRLGRRVSVDPVFGFLAGLIPLPEFLVGTPQRGHHHIVIHPLDRLFILDGLLELRRECVHPIYGCGMLACEIQERRKIVFQFIRA